MRFSAAAMLIAAVAACSPAPAVDEEPKAPKVEYTIEETTIDVSVGDAVAFGARILEGTNLEVSWSVDGEKIASTASVKWVFGKVGVSLVHFEAVNSLGSASRDYTVNVAGIPLVVKYSVEDEAPEAVIGTPFEVSVTVVSGDKSTLHAWTLDGADAGDGALFSKTFTLEEVGQHTLVYSGRNSDGMTASRTWNITVKDLPLQVNFTPAPGAISDAMVEDKISFSAPVVHGAAGAAWSWKVDGTEAGTEASFEFECQAEGVFEVSCDVTNAAGENASAAWTVTVSPKSQRSLMVVDAEGLTALPPTTILKGNDNALSLVDNPCVSTVNPGTKVIKDDLSSATWATSGLVQLYLDHITGEERYKYHGVRIKVFLGSNDYLPFMLVANNGKSSRPTMVNGTAFYPDHSKELWASLVRKDDWNVLEYNVVDGNYGGIAQTMADIGQVQFRLMVNYDNTNYPGSLSGTNTHIVYIDDIELVE